MSMNELESKVNELRELRRMAEELAAEISTDQCTMQRACIPGGAKELL